MAGGGALDDSAIGHGAAGSCVSADWAHPIRRSERTRRRRASASDRLAGRSRGRTPAWGGRWLLCCASCRFTLRHERWLDDQGHESPGERVAGQSQLPVHRTARHAVTIISIGDWFLTPRVPLLLPTELQPDRADRSRTDDTWVMTVWSVCKTIQLWNSRSEHTERSEFRRLVCGREPTFPESILQR